MAAMTGSVRVSIAGSDADVVTLEPGGTDAPAIVPFGPNRLRVGDGRDARPTFVRPIATLPDGRRRFEVVVDGWRFELETEDAARWELRRRATRDVDAVDAAGPAEIRAVIPGRVASVAVTAGDRVEVGRTLLVVEAMKMQNELRAPRAGTIERVAVAAGQTIERGDLLVVLS